MLAKLLLPSILLASQASAQPRLQRRALPDSVRLPPPEVHYQPPMHDSMFLPDQSMYYAMPSSYALPLPEEHYQPPMDDSRFYDVPWYGMPSHVDNLPPMYLPPDYLPHDIHAPLGAHAGMDTGMYPYGGMYGYGGMAPQNDLQPALHEAEPPHPSVVAEEQRKNTEQARQNLELKTKEIMDESEKRKKSIADQATQQIEDHRKHLDDQMEDHRKRLDDHVQHSHRQEDAEVKSRIDALARTVQDYEQRLEQQAKQALDRHNAKLVEEAVAQIQQEFKTAETNAKSELDEQLKSARAFGQDSSLNGAEEWANRARARYTKQMQELHQTKQANIRTASEQIFATASVAKKQLELTSSEPVERKLDDTN